MKNLIFLLACFISFNIYASDQNQQENVKLYEGYIGEVFYSFNQINIGDDKNSSYFTEDYDDYEVIYFFNYGCPSCQKAYPYFMLWYEKFRKENDGVYTIPTPITDKYFYTMDMFMLLKNYKVSMGNHADAYNLFANKENLKSDESYDQALMSLFQIKYSDLVDARNSIKYVDGIDYLNSVIGDFGITKTPTFIVMNKNYIYEINMDKLIDGLGLVVSLNLIHNIK